MQVNTEGQGSAARHFEIVLGCAKISQMELITSRGKLELNGVAVWKVIINA